MAREEEKPMAFWGVEVKVGETVSVDPVVLGASWVNLSQAALGEGKKDKASEPVVLYLNAGVGKKIVLGTLYREKIPQLSLGLQLCQAVELSHTSKNASVYFCGYKSTFTQEQEDPGGTSGDDVFDFTDSDDDLTFMNNNNGKPEAKAEEAKVPQSKKMGVAKVGASEKQVKIVDPKKDEEEESDDESGDEDEFGSFDEMDADSDSDEESESDEDDEEIPPQKVNQGKRPNDSASKTPVLTKKAKNATPDKTDGKKSVHTATPHPMKKGGKTTNSAAKTPNSGGQFSCKSCSKSFTSEGGLQQHSKAKHGSQ